MFKQNFQIVDLLTVYVNAATFDETAFDHVIHGVAGEGGLSRPFWTDYSHKAPFLLLLAGKEITDQLVLQADLTDEPRIGRRFIPQIWLLFLKDGPS